jgi:hypothetical protein
VHVQRERMQLTCVQGTRILARPTHVAHVRISTKTFGAGAHHDVPARRLNDTTTTTTTTAVTTYYLYGRQALPTPTLLQCCACQLPVAMQAV